jgi:hypothetical protein
MCCIYKIKRMSYQNINQYVYPKLKIGLIYDSMDMSLTSDERDFNEEVVFSPYLIAETYGNKLPINIDINNPLTSQGLNLTYKNFNLNNVFVSQNFFNPNDEDLTCFSSSTLCDVGLTGIDNGLVNQMTGETLNYTKGLYSDFLKFDRLYFDRRLKMFQVTGYTETNQRFSGINKTTLYEIVSKNDPFVGKYHELYGGFYQGFYKLFGFDYEVLPERVSKGWSVEMILKPRLVNEYSPLPNETTLNLIYPQNKNTFFYLGTRAENKFYHHADGHPNCLTGYTRVTNSLSGCPSTCACCDKTVTNSRCIYIYPPRSINNQHDPHINYGCDLCGGNKKMSVSCGCGCNDKPCETCGWECQIHNCETVILPTPTPTPTSTPQPTCVTTTPVCTPSCTVCEECKDCINCGSTGFTSIENTCETDPLFDVMSNNISFKLCGDVKNPQIGVKVLRFTGECETTGTCVTGQTYMTGYTIEEFCTPPIYPYCEVVNPAFLNEEHWFLVDVVWERYSWYDYCDLKYYGGLGDITKFEYLDSLAGNTSELIKPPLTHNNQNGELIELVNLNNIWLDDTKYRLGRLKIYVNGKKIFTKENFEEVIPRGLNTDKEKQIGVPFNISWGGGTQGLHENLTFSSCTGLTSNYIQDPECLPNNILSATTLSGLNTNILLEQNFGGTFEGAISQFRMYVEPLSSDEVKHNFKLLKGKFDLFDPDCPNCDTTICLTNDFTFKINDDIVTTTTTTTGEPLLPFELGRVEKEDKKDLNYLIKNNFSKLSTIVRPNSVSTITSRYWNDDGWWGDQGRTPQCVGFSWSHWLEDGPTEQGGIPPIVKPNIIYTEAQKIDEWPGENYAGTSVRAGAKYLQKIGKIKSYYWAFDLNTLIDTVMKIGPVVVGTNWYYNMFFPDKNGLIKVGGRNSGGHAYVINGVDIKNKTFRIKNSWGKNWGKNGRATISFNDMNRLIKERGEICIATEIGS